MYNMSNLMGYSTVGVGGCNGVIYCTVGGCVGGYNGVLLYSGGMAGGYFIT